MADFESIRKQIEDASNSISKINKDLSESNRFANTFVETFSNLAGMRTTGGTIWSVIDRFSGQSFYFLQKNVRGFMVLFRLAERIEQDRVNAAKDMNEQMEQQGEFLSNFLTTYKSIDTVQNSNNKLFAKSLLMQKQVNRLKIREMGFADYLKESRNDALKGIKAQLKIERELVNTEKARQNLGSASKAVLGDRFKTGFFGDGKEEAAVIQLLQLDEEINALRMAKRGASEEDREELDRRIDDTVVMANAVTEVLREEFGIETEKYGGRVSKIEKSPTESFFQKMKTPAGR